MDTCHHDVAAGQHSVFTHHRYADACNHDINGHAGSVDTGKHIEVTHLHNIVTHFHDMVTHHRNVVTHHHDAKSNHFCPVLRIWSEKVEFKSKVPLKSDTHQIVSWKEFIF